MLALALVYLAPIEQKSRFRLSLPFIQTGTNEKIKIECELKETL